MWFRRVLTRPAGVVRGTGRASEKSGAVLHLQPDWSVSPDMLALEFVAEGPERTWVNFEHRYLERHDGRWEREGGGPMIPDEYFHWAARTSDGTAAFLYPFSGNGIQDRGGCLW